MEGIDQVEYATLEWVDWFNHRRLLEPIGHLPPAEFEANHYRRETPSSSGNPTPKQAMMMCQPREIAIWVRAAIRSAAFGPACARISGWIGNGPTLAP
jgi:hypothetical protein